MSKDIQPMYITHNQQLVLMHLWNNALTSNTQQWHFFIYYYPRLL